MIRSSIALPTASWRLDTSNFARSCEKYRSTVRSLIFSSEAILRDVYPCAESARQRFSCGVSGAPWNFGGSPRSTTVFMKTS
jgi:hypothetical protein